MHSLKIFFLFYCTFFPVQASLQIIRRKVKLPNVSSKEDYWDDNSKRLSNSEWSLIDKRASDAFEDLENLQPFPFSYIPKQISFSDSSEPIRKEPWYQRFDLKNTFKKLYSSGKENFLNVKRGTTNKLKKIFYSEKDSEEISDSNE
ncbi:uncharacterized protein LOC122503349 [Leptopilina heterotoma]|uniref:uncharacterized protein LOC122503349 n=1 Tax=Leptopilina heterotoma TaxID=63436 RepID=UPI001CA8DA1A|nr:uncharacterized protein LOC122503349 [Leptopilina heterotoma]